ncbi:spatacsin carboxy-terminus protein isoform X2 [Tasmannia lanceolata]|uniref:spatacsin carboxy-terminus protein isoform X2 n=1 Tax=Tasmannia lanceolata TaxID=3420 RepID=UPI0040644F13
MDMFPSCEAGNGPSVLQLQKWGHSQAQFNLSEFREAFISPTRELLLLLTYQCEALLLPLISGEVSFCTLMNKDDSDTNCSGVFQKPHSLPFGSTAQTASSRSDSLYNTPYTSEPVKMVHSSAFPLGSNLSTSKKYPVVCDVKSLAWGHCGDDYNQHKDTAFKELLFVSGDRGITVHGFCCPDKNNEGTKSAPEGEVVRGSWVEWGPSATPMLGNAHDLNSDDGSGEYSMNNTSKNWLRTFLTEVETVESEGNFMARFPAKSSFPCFAEVVSFNISFSTYTFSDFLSCHNPVSDEKENLCKETLLPEADSHYGAAGMGILFQCSRVFSSSSHRSIGFVLTSAAPAPINCRLENGQSESKIIVVVSMVYQWGLQWVCSVELDSIPSLGPKFEWTDFKFSDELLICLNSSGLISIWDATTGKFIVRLDVLRCCGLNLKPQTRLEQSERSIEGHLAPTNTDAQIDLCNEVYEKTTDQVQDHLCSKRVFKRLMVALNSSLLATVDECGIVYVICVDEYISDKYYSFNKLIPHFKYCGSGLLAAWKVAGSEIGGQRVFSDISNSPDLTFSSIENEKLSCTDHSDRGKFWKKQKHSKGKGSQFYSNLSGLSSAAQMKDCHIPPSESLSPMRRVFLPIDGFGEEDSICFSPFGITRLVNRCNLKDQKGFRIVHTCLHVASSVLDDRGLNMCLQPRCVRLPEKEKAFLGEAIGCLFQGYLYLVSQDGLSVVLPSVPVSPADLPVESIGYWQPSTYNGYRIKNLLAVEESKEFWRPWKIEVLDRALLYEGPEEADHICLENGWGLKIARMRHLQLALHYLKFEEIEQSLEMLVNVNLAEEGILRLLFTAIYQICKVGSENEIALASRLLVLAARFATKMIRRYGLVEHKKDVFMFEGIEDSRISYLQPKFPNKKTVENGNRRRLREMAQFLEVIRNLQCRLGAKSRQPVQGLVDGRDASSLVDLPQDDPHQVLNMDVVSLGMPLEAQNLKELSLPAPDVAFDSSDKLALFPIESFSSSILDSGNSHESQSGAWRRKMVPLENPKDMVARWEVDNLDLKNVVKDALHSGRLPLAVLQLHLQRLRVLDTEKEPYDTFSEVRDVGRDIAYDLFLKGETGLAVATLQRLGEDIETSLRQLVFGTVKRSLRMRIAEEMKRYGYLRPYELKILERMSLIERLYPSRSFWGTFLSKWKQSSKVSSGLTLPEGNRLQLTGSSVWDPCIIECGEVDGVVMGSWANVHQGSSDPVVDEDDVDAGYWAAAAVWSDAWDQTTIDRIVLDQPFLMGVHVLWESQLEYHICHNDWEEVSKLLDMIPTSLLIDGSLQINLDRLHSTATVGCNEKFPLHNEYFCPAEELDGVCINVPNIKIFHSSAINMCSMWLRALVEQELAKKFIFMKEYWEGTAEIIPLLARTSFIYNKAKISFQAETSDTLSDFGFSNFSEDLHKESVEAFHKLVIHHCARYNLPNLLDIYLDHHKLALDSESLGSLLEAAGECQWAKWLLLSRIKGHEYDASFANSRSIISHNVVPDSNLGVPEVNEIIHTIDDMAEVTGEMAALATLMYAPIPIQKCLSSGSVNRLCSSSAQCTLENLRPGLLHFPTLWRTLVSACFGQDVNGNPVGLNAKNDYLGWRDSIFSSAGGDTSLVQMLPCWFSKAIRRLVQIFSQGPLGLQSISGAAPMGESFLHRDTYFDLTATENAEAAAIAWEAANQKNIEEELYASSFEGNGFGVEHHLHRGRALAAFNHLIGVRALKLKSTYVRAEPSGASLHGQTNVQSDVQTLLAPLTQDEESLLSPVMPLAIMHFDRPVLIASCAFLLELCGLSASLLRVDIAALRRISSFHKSVEYNEHYKHLAPKGFTLHASSNEGDFTISLARALADDYLHHNNVRNTEIKGTHRVASISRPSRAFMSVLQHLERASLPLMVDGKTCGSWLFCGSGDGSDFRSQQKTSSQHWNLVIAFCQMHNLPLSTKYLAVLAKDNDWVGFLTEAQVGGYRFDVIIQVASSEFSDPRLKSHILTVLRSMHTMRKKVSSTTNSTPVGKINEPSFSAESNIMIPAELFGLLAECEKQKSPGEALLIRAKNLRWSLLAMVASCFPDVSSLSCLTVWLEITAARETSFIKVNDIASQISKNVGAAVEATNALPTGNRGLTFRYNRRNPKRRRLMESASGNAPSSSPSDVSSTFNSIRISGPHKVTNEEERRKLADEQVKVLSNPDEGLVSLSNMVAVLCEQHLFLPLLRAFDMFLPSCPLLPFIRSLQAFSQMRLSEAAAHLASFSARLKEERHHMQPNVARDGQIGTTWISLTAVKAAEAMLSTCPSAYEKRCLLQLLASADFGDGGSAATCFRRIYWKINLAEPSLRKDDDLYLGNEILDDASLLTALEKNGHWEQARNWARQLESSGAAWKSAVHHVTETQAEAMVAEWKEFLWDVPEERAALWGHCQTLFVRYSFPPLQAGLFFLKHAEAVEKDITARELHEMLLLSLQWLSGTITKSNPVYPLNLLREIETRVWLLAVESEAQVKTEGDVTLPNYSSNHVGVNITSIIEQTATTITRMDNHLISMRARATEKNDTRENNQTHPRHLQVLDASSSSTAGSSAKTKRRAKSYLSSRRSLMDAADKTSDPDDSSNSPCSSAHSVEQFKSLQLQEENVRIEASVSGWEERVGPAELERAVLSLLEFGQVTAAKQLHHKLSPAHMPFEFSLVDVALKIASISSSSSSEVSASLLDPEILSVLQSYDIPSDNHLTDPLQVLEIFASKCTEGCGHGLCKRIIVVVKAANVLGLSFSEAYAKRPIELLQLLSLKAQDSLEEAKLLVQTHFMPPASIAQILAESFLKGLLAAHRGGYMDSQKEEGPAPLLWRFSDFLKWAELCPLEPEIGHALMQLVIRGQEIPHACEVELLILSHHFYMSSDCLDGVDVLVSFAANRVESYVSEGDFSCLARLVTGVSNFHALNFILGILIENGQLELLLHKYSAADTTTGL